LGSSHDTEVRKAFEEMKDLLLQRRILDAEDDSGLLHEGLLLASSGKEGEIVAGSPAGRGSDGIAAGIARTSPRRGNRRGISLSAGWEATRPVDRP
jgi:hypothetical protein